MTTVVPAHTDCSLSNNRSCALRLSWLTIAGLLDSVVPPLRIPAVLAFTVIGVAAGATASSCGESDPPGDASCRYCVYETVDNGNCPFPTCAQGSQHDQCPPGCIPAPIA
jgi:hypothetical protein